MSIYDVNKLPVVIPIGVQTENGVEPVGFDIRAWQDVWDDIKVNVWLTRPGEDAAYPAADTELVGTVLYWYPSEADTAIHGNGKVELLGLTEDKRKLSGWCETNVRPTSLATTQEMPEAVRPWVDQVMLAAAQAEAAVEKMPSIGENGNWHAWDANAGEYVDTGKPSRGEQGLQGIQGIPGQQGIQGERGLPGERGLTGERGPAGNPGKDGTSVTVANVSTSSEDGGTNTVTFSDGKTLSVKNGSKGSTGATGATGPTGPAGSTGKDGTSVTVASVATSSADGGANVVTFSDGKTVTILNGSKGSQGIQGVQGPAGSPGKDGRDGVDGDTRVYIGSDEPPEDAELWVDPEGTVNSDDLPQASEENAGVVTLDATLTKQGAAADAKAVGAKVAKLSEEIAKLPTTGGGAAIIDVTELPETDIREDVFYRLVTGTFYAVGTPMNQYVCHVVDVLPETGEPATNVDMSAIVMYYNTADGTLNGYLTAELAAAFGLTAGWYPAEMLFQVAGAGYGGAVTDIKNASDPTLMYLLLEYVMYQHKSGVWAALKGIGWAGDGNAAEVFNTLKNTAKGECSHAEGYMTIAEGSNSHAEGSENYARGANAHAEGLQTSAYGDSSHAEGNMTEAWGNDAHAEGSYAIAKGDGSHAEGYYTTASSAYQHVQGKWNIADSSGKCAHIVGNGEQCAPSNAHTLDWDGNAWYQGTVESAGMLLTSQNGTKYKITVADDGTLTATVVTE